MPTKKPRAHALESATARRKLPIAKKPVFVKIAPNIRLGYRRNAGPGAWSVRVTGPGVDWIKKLALADDHEPADGRAVLTYWQALDQARKLARRQPGDAAGDDARPITLAEALTLYEKDLVARGGDIANAKRVRLHVPASLASKPVALLRTVELTRWRDGLIEKGLSRASINRTRNALRAALSLAARRDHHRIANQRVWQDPGLFEALPNATQARNIILPDDVVAKLITAAHERDRKLGLFTQVIAETGSRPSQVARLTVADLDAPASRLMMPRSGKGHPHKRAMKLSERVPVPISAQLAGLLKQEARGRASTAMLLTRNNGEPWGHRRHDTTAKISRPSPPPSGSMPA